MSDAESTEDTRALTVAPQPLPVTMPTRTLPTRDELSIIGSIAASVVKAAGHAVPKDMDSPYKAVAVMLAGWELGMKPMTALRHIFVVNGRTEPDAQAMMGVVRALDPTAQFIFHEWTAEVCRVELRRQGQAGLTIEYTIEDARQSGQTKTSQGATKSTWANYARDMLAWAAVKRVCRLGAPELINAIPSVAVEDTEGMVEAAGLLGEGETVDEETGEILEAEAVQQEETAPPSDEADPPAPDKWRCPDCKATNDGGDRCINCERVRGAAQVSEEWQ